MRELLHTDTESTEADLRPYVPDRYTRSSAIIGGGCNTPADTAAKFTDLPLPDRMRRIPDSW